MKLAFSLIFTGLLALSGCSGSESRGASGDTPSRFGSMGQPGNSTRGGPNDIEAVSVKGFTVVRQPISSFILSNTSLEAIRTVTIFAKINALIEKLNVEEGTVVRRNQVLAKLEDREIQNDFKQAQIALDQAESAVRQAEVRSELSKANYERSLTLREQKLISQQEFDQAALTNRTDSLALEVATQQKGAARARLEAAQIQLDYTEIRSSIDGVVTRRLIEVGTRVNVNQEVFTVADYPPLWARIGIPEKELPQLRVGQTARLKVQAFPDEEFAGKILMISPTIDPESGTVKVTLEVRGPRNQLRPGMFGTVYIATETHPDALVIPKRAVMRERDEDRVFVVKPDSTVEKRVVQLGFNEDDQVEVTSGLESGEIIVTVGQEGLNDGYPVSILAWDGEPGEAPSRPQPGASTDPQGTERPAAGQSEASPGQGRGGPGFGPPGGQPDPERLKMFLERMLANPAVKEAYDARLKEDPKFADDPEKLGAFLREMRQKMGRGRQ